MASLTVTTSSKNSSRSASPSRANLISSHSHQQQVTGSSDHTSKSRNASASHQHQHQQQHHTTAESSHTVGVTMKSGGGVAARQRSPGALARAAEGIDDSANVSFSTDVEEYAILHPPIEDESLDASYGHHQAGQHSSFMSNGSSELIGDDVDASSGRVRQAIEHIQNKIAKTRELIKTEQTTRDENVNEYLKLAANADKQQRTRIKTVFEKKNQKSSHNILLLQKKLDSYTKKLRNYEMNGAQMAHRQPREVLRDMGQGLKNVGGNIRDGITGFSGSVMSKPREFAHLTRHLIKNKFGSADNINSISRNNGDSGSVEDESGNKAHHGSATLPGGCSLGSNHSAGETGAATGAAGGTSGQAGIKFPSEEGSECSSVTSESGPGSRGQAHACGHEGGRPCSLKSIFAELQDHRENMDRLREKLDAFKNVQQEVSYLSHALQEERFRSERLEEQINDLTELHQNEVENLKQTITDMEEKVQYQSEDRMRDIHEMLESCQTKIWKMEHQQQQHQQYVTLEGLDNSNARALVVKLINVVLTVLQVILLLVATGAGIMMPFLRTSCTKPHCFMCRVRILTTTFVVLGIVFVLKQWPEVHDVGSHLMRHLKQTLAVK
ncbi:transmembrane and coiled-coil domains protein 2 isoform X3 [Nasonia vitripennis]|uniref:Transmembrane and coiled-coil domains protein 1 n=1 Tax=Nasonia vitripennis TaxID=7425 RepID=A0A7M7H436_NASVI|nr:transmembrane and coiled-coil domains protein 2 isoform X3 [Nasonia vitripennis]